jgi:rhodanese-related sulfurtransferase
MAEPAKFYRVDPEFARALIEGSNPRILDVRNFSAYERSHIDGADHATEDNLQNFLFTTPKDRPVLIYCAHGTASEAYAQTFADFHFTKIYSLDGGYEAYANAQAQWKAAASATPAVPLSDALQNFLELHGFPPGQVNAVASNGMTPLMRAAVSGPPALVAELLKAGARVDARNLDGNEVLWLACVGDDPEIVAMVIAAGANLEHRNVNGATALMYAASAGKGRALEQLLKAGADLETEVDGFTALDMAASLECLNLMRAEKRRRRQFL